MTSELLFMVGGLALLDTLSPAALGVTVYLLLIEKERLRSRLIIYLLTVAVLYFSVGIALMLGLDALLATFSSIFQNQIVSWAMLIIGGILFIASFFYPKSRFPLLVAYNFIMILPPLILLALHLLLGRMMKRPLERLRINLSKHSGSAVSWVMCIVGLILVFYSLDYL